MEACAPFFVTANDAAFSAKWIAVSIEYPLLKRAAKAPQNVSPAAVVSTAQILLLHNA